MKLNQSALDEAMQAYWDASGGTQAGIEAAITAYLQSAGFRPSDAEIRQSLESNGSWLDKLKNYEGSE